LRRDQSPYLLKAPAENNSGTAAAGLSRTKEEFQMSVLESPQSVPASPAPASSAPASPAPASPVDQPVTQPIDISAILAAKS
jgi:hypothetical protein